MRKAALTFAAGVGGLALAASLLLAAPSSAKPSGAMSGCTAHCMKQMQDCTEGCRTDGGADQVCMTRCQQRSMPCYDRCAANAR